MEVCPWAVSAYNKDRSRSRHRHSTESSKPFLSGSLTLSHTGHRSQLAACEAQAMEAGGGAVGVGGGAPAAGAGAAVAAIRAVARVHVVLGLATAAFAICVATLHPQLKEQGGDCAATDEDAVGMRTHGLLLLLSAGAQAAAATVAAFAPDSWRLGVAWTMAVLAHFVSMRTGFHLFVAFAVAGAIAVGSCPGHLNSHAADVIIDFVLLLIPLCVFFVLGVRALVIARPW